MGDILLVHYNIDPIGYLIRWYTHSYWNHCAWILNDCALIESKRTGILVSSINRYDNKFLFKTKAIKIKNLTYKQKRIIAMYLIKSCTKKTSYLSHIWSFLLILCHFKGNTSKKTCSGLLAHAFAQIGRIFCHKPLDFVTPADIAQSTEVYYD